MDKPPPEVIEELKKEDGTSFATWDHIAVRYEAVRANRAAQAQAEQIKALTEELERVRSFPQGDYVMKRDEYKARAEKAESENAAKDLIIKGLTAQLKEKPFQSRDLVAENLRQLDTIKELREALNNIYGLVPAAIEGRASLDGDERAWIRARLESIGKYCQEALSTSATEYIEKRDKISGIELEIWKLSRQLWVEQISEKAWREKMGPLINAHNEALRDLDQGGRKSVKTLFAWCLISLFWCAVPPHGTFVDLLSGASFGWCAGLTFAAILKDRP